MREFLKLRPLARTYVTVVVLFGAATVAHSVHQLYSEPIGRQWFILAALTLLTGSFTVKVPSTNASLSVSETFVFASVLLFGPAAGAVTVLLECLIIQFWMKPGTRLVHRVLFNTAAPAIAIWLSGTVFFSTAGIVPYSRGATPLEALFLPLALFTALYFLLNSWLVAFALGFETQTSPAEIWWKNFTWLSVNYFSGASVAALLVAYTHRVDISTLLVIVPLLVVSYLTFRTAMGRVEDSNQHLSELNRLHLSTIETLAMAIDAKDQVTHGHIRRVQSYATGLAREVGVRDDKLIRAIEAAALLHDMGKLAVPEYILNKPGKLTDTEFEKMKLHASVGADILSAIDFPYPVVPIVRHHHENWDGTGYPAGLKGTAIPIGARILSVVDCFDALTSDRPYRPRLSNAESVRILLDRRGSMYDPLVVDTFIRVHESIAPEPTRGCPPSFALNEIASARKTQALQIDVPVLDEIAASADEMLTLYELARSLAGQVSLSDAADVIAKHLRRLIPSSLCVFYVHDQATNELEAKHAIGEGTSVVKGVRIPLGQRLSGWVAANRQTILNSDPVLDLGDAARSQALRLRSCLSTPLLHEDHLVGVLSLYSGEHNGFNEDHRRIIEAAARQIAHTFQRAIEFERTSRRDTLTGLPHLDQLEQIIHSHATADPGADTSFALLLIEVVELKHINVTQGRPSGDEVLRHVANQVRRNLRVADILFRNSSDEFIAFLNDADAETARNLAERIRERVIAQPFQLATGASMSLNISVTAACAPRDGASIKELISIAKGVGFTHPSHLSGSSVH
jgi:diguanylate cyclase (GGDEF)-like protein/putative nucleotidyltransferase with HDIG domain